MNNSNDVLSLAVNIGKSMVKYGAEINRVEETIIRICKAHGFLRVDVFSMVSLISVTAQFDGNEASLTQTRRIYHYSPDFARLDDLNQLSRDICEYKLNLIDAKQRYDQITKDAKRFHPSVLIGSILAASSFAIFFGGDFKDSICAGLIAVPVYFLNTFTNQSRFNRLFYTVLTSALAACLALVFQRISFASNSEYVMIGDIMLLIPGLMLVNSFRELLCGDIVSGATRLLDSVMVAIAIACGYAVPILTFAHFGW